MSPNQQLRAFVLLSVLGLVAFFGLSQIGVRHFAEQNNLRLAEQSSIAIAQSIYRLEKSVLTDPRGDTLRQTLPSEELQPFDARIRSWLAPLNVVKVKVFAKNTQIVFSTDPSIIGAIDEDNASLLTALNGGISSAIQTRDAFLDMADETRLGVDVVETYVPIRSSKGRVVGAMEVYLDVTTFRQHTEVAISSHLWVSFVLLPVVFGVLLLLMWRSTRALNAKQAELTKLAGRDPLTGLYNRRVLNERLSAELRARHDRKNDSEALAVGVVLCDLDHFKQVNDQFGHLAGDHVLTEISTLLRGSLRQDDLIGRFGGEEFLLIMKGPSVGEVKQGVERLRSILRDTPIQIGEQQARLTASFGLTFLNGEDRSIDDALGRADLALYGAKQDGRDRIGQA